MNEFVTVARRTQLKLPSIQQSRFEHICGLFWKNFSDNLYFLLESLSTFQYFYTKIRRS